MKTKSTPRKVVVSKEGVKKYTESRVPSSSRSTTSSGFSIPVFPPHSPPLSSKLHPIHATEASYLAFTTQQATAIADAYQKIQRSETQLLCLRNMSCKNYFLLKSNISRLNSTIFFKQISLSQLSHLSLR